MSSSHDRENLTLEPDIVSNIQAGFVPKMMSAKKSRASYHDNSYALFVVNSGVLLVVF